MTDEGLAQLVACWPEDAPALTQSPYIKHITFIGSEEVGRKVRHNHLVPAHKTTKTLCFQVAQAATLHLTPVTLELGGKDPAIILPETDIEKWAPTWMRGVLCVSFLLHLVITDSSYYF